MSTQTKQQQIQRQPPQQQAPLAVRGAPFEPENLQQAMDLATMLAASSLVPRDLRGKPSDILVVMLKGRELGVPPMTALSEIYVIEGKPSVSSILAAGLVQKSGTCVRLAVVESTDKICKVEAQRVGQEARSFEYTIEEARNANLLGKDNWKKYPKDMLTRRCVYRACRAEWPEVMAGLIEPDEVEEVRERVQAENPPAKFVAPPLPKREEPEDAQVVERDDPKEEVGSFAADPSAPTDIPFDPPPPPAENEMTEDEVIAGFKQLMEQAETLKGLDDIARQLNPYPKDGRVRTALSDLYWARKKALGGNVSGRRP